MSSMAARRIPNQKASAAECVGAAPPAVPFQLVSREHTNGNTAVRVGDVMIGCVGSALGPAGRPHRQGQGQPLVIAGPCSVESYEQMLRTARAVKRAGATMLRGGAYKPRTSPYEFQGLGLEALEILRAVRRETGMPVVSEVMSTDDIDLMAEHVDMLQVGARNMQNFALLRRLGAQRMPVLLKRSPAASVREWLLAAEYLLAGANRDVVLCERGIKGFDPDMRNTFDIAAIALAKQLTHLPVIADPSHAAGRRDLIPALSRAALAVGADGLMIEVHPDPAAALSDGKQSLDFADFGAMMRTLPGQTAVAA